MSTKNTDVRRYYAENTRGVRTSVCAPACRWLSRPTFFEVIVNYTLPKLVIFMYQEFPNLRRYFPDNTLYYRQPQLGNILDIYWLPEKLQTHNTTLIGCHRLKMKYKLNSCLHRFKNNSE